MKLIDPALAAHLASRGVLTPRVLVWFHAVLRADGSPAGWGVWNGDDDRTFSIGGTDWTYFGAGAMGEAGTLVSEAGYAVRLHRIALAHYHPDVADRLALTDIRLRRVEIHQVHLAIASHDLVAPPIRRFNGSVESLRLPRPQQGGSAMAEVQIASSARDLTRALSITKSDATLKAVYAADTFRRWNAVSGTVTTSWGEVNSTPPKASGGFIAG